MSLDLAINEKCDLVKPENRSLWLAIVHKRRALGAGGGLQEAARSLQEAPEAHEDTPGHLALTLLPPHTRYTPCTEMITLQPFFP